MRVSLCVCVCAPHVPVCTLVCGPSKLCKHNQMVFLVLYVPVSTHVENNKCRSSQVVREREIMKERGMEMGCVLEREKARER